MNTTLTSSHSYAKQQFFALYKDSQQVIFQIAYSILKDVYLAQDVTQETFLKAYLNWHTLQDPEKAVAWLRVIVRHTALNQLSSERRRPIMASDADPEETETGTASPSVEGIVMARWRDEQLRQIVGELRSEFAEVLVLRYGAGLKNEEIAERLGLESGTVKSRLHRAKRQVRKKWSERFQEDRFLNIS